MQLEVITRSPPGPAHPVPLLFVHGAYGGAWIWDHHFLPYFAEHGFTAHAVSLRGHGESGGWESLPFARLRDYVADVGSVVASLPQLPVLIGHSMGGMVVQKYLHAHANSAGPGAVLMASVPPHGMIGTFVGMAFTNPDLFQELARIQAMGPLNVNGFAVRRALFSDDTPDETVSRFLEKFQPESSLVILDLMGIDLPPSTPVLDLPVLVLGAEKDMFVFPGALHATAETYRTEAEIFPGMAHAMMLDHGWQHVADRILAWLSTILPPADATADLAETSLG